MVGFARSPLIDLGPRHWKRMLACSAGSVDQELLRRKTIQ